MSAQEQFKASFSQIRAGRKIEDFWGEDIPYSILRAASESMATVSSISLQTRLENHKALKRIFG